MRLSPDTIGALADTVAVPHPPSAQPKRTIVHFGLGAFARAHLASYTDGAEKAAPDRPGWSITGVSMRSADVADRLNPQGGLFTVTERSGPERSIGLVRSIGKVLVRGRDDAGIVDALASSDCAIASFTVTEKGYCRTPSGLLDFEQARAGFYPLLAEALDRRRQAQQPGLTLLSCDNLTGNGRILSALVEEWLQAHDADLAQWFAEHCTAPSTMVDRIVPASSPSDLDMAECALGLRDEAAVFTEPFSQWVIEDSFAGPRPCWEEAGAQFVTDVAPYELAKLRMLNGAHSLLAYVGLARAHAHVHEAMADPSLRALVERLMREEAAPTLVTGGQLDTVAYAGKLMARFDNAALEHRLLQIAMDGSEKIPQRWLGTLASSRQPCPAILTGIAAWLLHVETARPLDDPQADLLRRLCCVAADTPDRVDAIFGPGGPLASNWRPTPGDIRTIGDAFEELQREGDHET